MLLGCGRCADDHYNYDPRNDAMRIRAANGYDDDEYDANDHNKNN